MNGIVPAGQPASISVTYSDPGLFIGLQMYDDSGSTPVAVGSVIPMLNWAGVSYRAQFQGTPGKWYLYQIAAYTDDTFATVDDTQPMGDGDLYFQAQGQGLIGRFLTGYLGCNNPPVCNPCNSLDPLSSSPQYGIPGAKVNLGSAFTIDFFIVDLSSGSPKPVNLSGTEEIVVIMANADGTTFLELKMSLSMVTMIDADDGHFQALGTAAQSALLLGSGINNNPPTLPSYSDIEVHITDSGGDENIVLFPQSINLIPRLFPLAP